MALPLGDETLEPGQVERARLHRQDVPGCLVAQRGDRPVPPRQHPPQVGQVRLQGGLRASGEAVAPQFVDELIGGHHLAQPDQQQSQHGPVPWGTERHLLGPAPSRHHTESLERQICQGRGLLLLSCVRHAGGSCLSTVT